MQITDIRVRVVSKESKMKAVVSVTFDDAFAVHDIKVIEGEKGLFIAMPSKKVCLSQCRAARQVTENTVILRIRFMER